MMIRCFIRFTLDPEGGKLTGPEIHEFSHLGFQYGVRILIRVPNFAMAKMRQREGQEVMRVSSDAPQSVTSPIQLIKISVLVS